jgi:hypothetical protein
MKTTTARRNTTAEMIEVLQAHERGETIESRRITIGEYQQGEAAYASATAHFNFAARQYRVKPKPVERYGIESASGKFFTTVATKESAERMAAHHRGRFFLMREVEETFDTF